MIEVLVFLVFFVVTGLLLLGIAWRLSYQDKFFTRLETGDIKFIVAGESWVRTLINIPGMKLDSNGKIIIGDQSQTWLQKELGLYWVGIYPFKQIHSFEITKEKENQRIAQNQNSPLGFEAF